MFVMVTRNMSCALRARMQLLGFCALCSASMPIEKADTPLKNFAVADCDRLSDCVARGSALSYDEMSFVSCADLNAACVGARRKAPHVWASSPEATPRRATASALSG